MVVAHGMLVYQFADVEFVLAEDEAPDGKSSVKEGKEISSEKIGFAYAIHRCSFETTLRKNTMRQFFTPSEGYYDRPYNPPEAA